jgi:membrane-associated phospholipid phosphatase
VTVRRSPWWILVAGVCAAVLAWATAVALDGVPDWESSLFTTVHDVPRWVDHVLWLPMQLGSAWAPALVALLGWWLTRSWRPTVGALVVGWGGWWLAKAVKDAVDRGRPAGELASDLVRSSAITEGLGFVSGHSTVAFACATVLAPYLSRPWRVVAYALALLVAVSRVVVGAHFPLDVIGGAALGTMLAALWHLAVGVTSERKPS